MGLKQKEEIKYFTFDIFEKFDFIKCCISTKDGGVSKDIYKSMNLSFTIGDEEENVYENYKIFSQKLGFTYDNIQKGFQTHNTNYNYVNKENLKKFEANPHFLDTDILITDEKNIPLVTLFADCVPIFLVDTKNKAIGVVHAGWRGTLNEISKVAVKSMQKHFNTKAEDLFVGIGPSINPCCFLVDVDVYEQFYEYEEYRPFIKKVDNKYSINLQEINKLNLLKSDLAFEENIEISSLCTCCNEELFFSHRRQNLQRGSMAGFLEIIK